MKTITKTTTLVLIFTFLLVNLGISQTVKYGFTYDKSGNRTQRKVITIPSKSELPENFDIANETPTSVEDYLLESKITFYPNPVFESLNIDFSNFDGLNKTINVYDINSKLIYTQQCNNNQHVIPVHTWRKGNYILEVIVNNNKKEWPLIKL